MVGADAGDGGPGSDMARETGASGGGTVTATAGLGVRSGGDEDEGSMEAGGAPVLRVMEPVSG